MHRAVPGLRSEDDVIRVAPFPPVFSFFFFNDTATTEIYTLSLHDALPISVPEAGDDFVEDEQGTMPIAQRAERSEEHTSELQSPCNLVCRLLLEKKKEVGTVAAAAYQFCRRDPLREAHPHSNDSADATEFI